MSHLIRGIILFRPVSLYTQYAQCVGERLDTESGVNSSTHTWMDTADVARR